MVYDHDCSTVVVLNNPPGPRKVARSNTSFVKFWPDQDYATYGPVFSVQTVDKLVQPDFSVWQLRLGKKHALKIYDQFTLNTSCFSEYYTGCAISRNFCYKNNE